MIERRAEPVRMWTVRAGETARLTPEGPTAAVVETRHPLPLRARCSEGSGPLARLHPGTAVVLGGETFEVVRCEQERGCVKYRLAGWPRDLVIRDRVVYGAPFVETAAAARRQAAAQRAARPFQPLLEMVAALLPGPERAALVDRLSLDPLRGTLLIGLLQVVLCGCLWPAGFITFYRGHLDSIQGQVLREQRDVTARDFAEADAYAAVSPIIYLLSPPSLGLLYGFWTGAARLVHSRVAGSALGDPVLSLLLGTVRFAIARSRTRRRLQQLGPQRPDRIVPDGEGLLVFSARAKPEWTGSATIQVGDRFLRVASVFDRPDGAWMAVCYRLTPVPAGEVYRGLVRYAAPADPVHEDPRRLH